MKKILLALTALLSAAAFGATTVPVQMLNPTGSSSGQAVVSNGSSVAPTWQSIVDSVVAGSGIAVSGATGNVTVSVATNGVALAQLAQQSANTVLANATGSTANVAAFAMPSCSTSASALNWTTSTGFTCNTAVNAATLSGNAIGTSGTAVPLLSGANTWGGAQTFSAIITPSTTNGIKGTTAADNANAGSIGEFPSPTNLSGVSLTNNTGANVSSVSLTAGDWDVQCVVQYSPASTTVLSSAYASVSTTSAALGSFGSYSTYQNYSSSASGTNSVILASPVTRVNISTTTTTYCVAYSVFNTSTATATGFMRARRIR